MSPATSLHVPRMHGAAPHARVVRSIVSAVAAAAVIAGLLTITLLVRSPAAAEDRPQEVAPVATQATAASSGTGVPEASVVFKGRHLPEQEPAPTF